MKISIVIPAYNEENRIGKTLEAYSDYFEKLKRENELDYEILIVINNTADKTEDIVLAAKKKNPAVRHLNFKQGGKGFAIIEGFKDSLTRENDLIGFVDADMATSPDAFHDLVKNIGSYDGAIADRYSPFSRIEPTYNFRRIVVSRVFNMIVRTLFGFKFRDTQCGAKVFRKDILKKILNDLTITEWAFDVDLLYSAKRNKFKIRAVPTFWREMSGSRLNIKKASIQMLFAVIQLRILRSKFKRVLNLLSPITKTLYGTIK